MQTTSRSLVTAGSRDVTVIDQPSDVPYYADPDRAFATRFNTKEPTWRTRFKTVIASFREAPFHIEQRSRSSGRRIVEHEYPKRDMPWGEDMGRHAIRYQITGYVIQDDIGPTFSRDYQFSRDALIAALEKPGPAVLVDPYMPQTSHLGYGDQVNLLFYCERYSLTETRQQGGYATFEMAFVECGQAANTTIYTFTQEDVSADAQANVDAAIKALNDSMPRPLTGYDFFTRTGRFEELQETPAP
jgi:hypothetical protein